jgi:hypothetical protein
MCKHSEQIVYVIGIKQTMNSNKFNFRHGACLILPYDEEYRFYRTLRQSRYENKELFDENWWKKFYYRK